jgi:II/X family phage/plasmid replication protein
MSEYPRRKVIRYGRESIFAPGTTTAVKAYHKGPEFSKHDHKRLRGIMQPTDLEDLQHYANRVLRWEVAVKPKKLEALNDGKKPRVSEISADQLRKLHYLEVRRLVKEGEAEVKTVRKQKQVRDRLLEVYEQRKAGLLLGTWHQLVTLGQHETKKAMKRPTFYRHLKELKDAGVSWIGADVLVVPKVSSLPADFSPTERDPRRRGGEDPKVAELLAPYRAA